MLQGSCVSEVPSGFSLQLYEDIVAGAMNEPVRLLLADEQQLLLPEVDELSEFERQRVHSLLAADRPDAMSCCVRMRDPQQGATLRLFALLDASERSRNDAFFAHFRRVLRRVCDCVNHVWSLSSEFDEMTDELTSRYEELHLLYQIDRLDNDGKNDGGTALLQLLEDAASHLQVPALLVFAPDDGLQILAGPSAHDPRVNDLGTDDLGTNDLGIDDLGIDDLGTDEHGGGQAQVLQSLGATLRELTGAVGGALVLNRMDDSRRGAALRSIDARIMAAPLVIGGSSNGVVAVLRPSERSEFRSHDSKFITVLADQLSSMLRGFRDDLTGLLNRRGFERRLTGFTESDGRSGGLLLYLDLHNFRVLNETCGRIAGDELLRQTAAVLVGATRSEDVVARTGADEFAILFSHCESDLASAVARNVLARLRRHEFVWAGRTQEFRASVGAVPLAVCSGDASHLLLAAELACERAIANGANSLYVYNKDDELVFEQRGRVQWVPKIHEALRADRFELHAQVIVPINANADLRHHHELLLRLRDEHGTMIGPNDFIPAAERFQLMPDIDRWVVRHALSTLASSRWLAAASQVVWSINLSGQSLSDERFHAFLIAELEKSDFPYENVCFEVTETAAVANHRAAIALMTSLQSRGVSFALDDFGTGLSSFAYLKNLPVSMLKIDGNFVKELVDDPFSRATVDAVNRVGKAVGLVTVAEYVENDAILDVLRQLDVDYAQGYGLGRPIALQSALTRLQEDLACAKPACSAQAVNLVCNDSAV